MSLHSWRQKFDKFESDYRNAQIDANGKRIKAADEATQENLDAATAAREAQVAKCREFRNWCTPKRNEIRQILDDSAGLQELDDDIVKQLPALEADCPPGEDPPPSVPDERRARRLRVR